MRTEVDKSFKWGFLLSEQDLRRIVQACHEHAEKIGALSTTAIVAKLKDGSLVESANLDDILALENGGHKSITRLTIRCDDGQQIPRSQILVQFEDSKLNPRNWNSITLKILGESRDAVFVAAADLEERLKKPRTRSWAYIVTRPQFLILPLILGMCVTSFSANLLSGASKAVDHLEQQYKSGRFHNSIEALIFFEREKAAGLAMQSLTFTVFCFGIPFLLFGLTTAFATRFSLSYVFYWGDAVTRYDRRKNVERIFWSVVVLGLLVSVVGGLILRVF